MIHTKGRAITILSFALVIVTLGFGMIIPLFPFYIEKLGASGSDYGLLISTAALFEFLLAPVWGSISDRTGRRPILMIGMLGYALSSLLFGLSTELWMLYASRALSGLLSSATSGTAMASISDSTTEEERSTGIGMLGAATGLGMILGPGLGGWLGATSLALPFFISAGLGLVGLLLIALLLPESLPRATRRAQAARLSQEAHTPGKMALIQFGEMWRVMWRALASPIGILLGMLFLVSFGLTNFESVFGLYAADKLGYGPEHVGTILVVVGIASTLGKATLIGPLTRRWGEALIARASLLASSAGFLLLLLAGQYVAVLLATGFFILSKTLLRTALLSLASRRAAVGQGAVMGLGNSFINLGRIVGPIWAGVLFDADARYPYISGAAIMAVGFIISLIWVSQKGKATTSG